MTILHVSPQAEQLSVHFLFRKMSSGADHPAEFDWRWRIVEHDLAVVAPFLMDEDGKLLASGLLAAQQQPFAELFTGLLQFNSDCAIELLPLVHAAREVYAGQQSVVIYGHAACAMTALEQVGVQQLFTLLKDHKVIIELTDTAAHGVLSQAQPLWQVTE